MLSKELEKSLNEIAQSASARRHRAGVHERAVEGWGRGRVERKKAGVARGEPRGARGDRALLRRLLEPRGIGRRSLYY